MKVIVHIFLTLLLFLSVVATTVFFYVFSSVFSFEAMRSLLQKADVYQIVVFDVMPQLLSSSSLSQNELLSKEDLVQIAQKTVTPAWLQTQTESIFANAFLFLEGSSDDPRLFVYTQHLKKKFPKAMEEVFQTKFTNLSVCTEIQIQQGLYLSATQGFPACRPEDLTEDAFLSFVGESQGEWESLMNQIPDVLDILRMPQLASGIQTNEPAARGSRIVQEVEYQQKIVSLDRFGMFYQVAKHFRFVFLLTALLLGYLLWIAVPHKTYFLLLSGISFFQGLAFGGLAVLVSSLTRLLSNMMSGQGDFFLIISPLLQGIVSVFEKDQTRLLFMLSAISMLLAVFLLVFGHVQYTPSKTGVVVSKR
ncbi:MAG TPA: hypothetical protein VJ179_03565 [Patescibacteria group bacterium]|nr:hypothetical protein [Patescibacteria group bacterium]